MQTGISKGEALSLLQQAMFEPLGLLVYASEPQPFIQALYRAKREDPSLIDLQIRQTHEGIAICHEPHPGLPQDDFDAISPAGNRDDNAPSCDQDEDSSDDQTIY